MASSSELLRRAAAALDDGRNPLVNPFLSDNDVTLDQCFGLAEHLALGARIVARAIESPRSPQGQAMLATLAESL